MWQCGELGFIQTGGKEQKSNVSYLHCFFVIVAYFFSPFYTFHYLFYTLRTDKCHPMLGLFINSQHVFVLICVWQTSRKWSHGRLQTTPRRNSILNPAFGNTHRDLGGERIANSKNLHLHSESPDSQTSAVPRVLKWASSWITVIAIWFCVIAYTSLVIEINGIQEGQQIFLNFHKWGVWPENHIYMRLNDWLQEPCTHTNISLSAF